MDIAFNMIICKEYKLNQSRFLCNKKKFKTIIVSHMREEKVVENDNEKNTTTKWKRS